MGTMKKILLLLLFPLSLLAQNKLTTQTQVLHYIDSLALSKTGIVPVANGGTGTATPSIIAGTNITNVTGTWPNQTINAATQSGGGGGSGTVTSVDVTVPAFLSVSGVPITTTGTAAISLSGTALPVANGGTGITSLTPSAWTSTVVGFSGTPTQTCRGLALGKIFFGSVNIFGTSNATNFTFTLPAGMLTVNTVTQRFSGVFISNNGSGAITGVVDFVANSNVVTVFRDVAAQAYTTSGGKSVFLNFMIEIQ